MTQLCLIPFSNEITTSLFYFDLFKFIFIFEFRSFVQPNLCCFEPLLHQILRLTQPPVDQPTLTVTQKPSYPGPFSLFLSPSKETNLRNVFISENPASPSHTLESPKNPPPKPWSTFSWWSLSLGGSQLSAFCSPWRSPAPRGLHTVGAVDENRGNVLRQKNTP